MHYELLGTIEARHDTRDDTERIQLGGTQQRRLLAVLLTACNRVISIDRLIDALWPDGSAPEGASRAVLTYVSRLRASIGSSAISTHGSGYLLSTVDSTVDAIEFEQLVQRARTAAPDQAVDLYTSALALWKGPAFGEFCGEWWAVAEAARLEELRVLAHEERAQAAIAMGQAAQVIPALEGLFVEFPLRDGVVWLLVQALDAAGRKAEALRVYQSHRRQLLDETGLDPSARVIELERALVSAEPVPTASGRLLRGYILHEAIGRGAHGTVYAARQPGTEREVAVKVIRAERADSSEFVRRFELEAQLVARLEHPHIVPLYDFWREPGGAYLVFRLLRGGTAEESLITGGRWSLDRAARLVEQIGGAMITAHAAGVVHRDLRPSNVLLDTDTNMFVSDFGIASEQGDLHGDFEAGVLTDVAHLATTVWELLAGSSPVNSSWRESLPSLVGRIPDLPVGIDAVLGRAVSSRAADRFESMAEFVLAWRAAVGRSTGSVGMGGARPTSSDRRLAASQLRVRAASGMNPYRGLRPFAEVDARDFFGREEAAVSLRQAVERSRFVAVVGASGLGKSSLVFAGLAPLLREDGISQVASMSPGEDPPAALHAALTEISVSPLDADDLGAATRSVAGQSERGLVLIVDQFEECWTLADVPRREVFIELLASWAESDVTPPVSVVVTLRADMYDRPLAHPRLGPLIAAETFPLAPMRAVDLEHAIGLPAARAHVDFEDGIVSSMVTEAVTNPASLPLLQFALHELYERRIDGLITTAVYDELGGVGGAIAVRAEQLLGALPDADQDRARRLFARLVTPGHSLPDSRRRCMVSELPPASRTIAEQFVTARLLVADHDPVTREPTIELAHESLLTAWSRLAGWIDDDRRWLDQLQHLSAAARSWDRSGRSSDELYRGSRLEAVLEELPGRRDQLTEIEILFIEHGRQARDIEAERGRRTVRRLRRLLAGVALLLILAVIAGSVALVQRRTAERTGRAARIGELVGAIGTVRSTRRDTAALLAIEAFRLSDTPATRSALFATFTSTQGFLDRHSLEGFGPDFSGVVMTDKAFVLDGDNRVRPYDLETGGTGQPFPSVIPTPHVEDLTGTPSHPAKTHVTALIGSADETIVAQLDGVLDPSGATTTSVALFDTRSGRSVADPFSVDIPAGTLAIDPTSTGFVVSGGYDGSVVAVDIASGRETGHLDGFTPAEQLSNQLWRTAGLAYLDADHLAVGSVADQIRIVDPTTLEEVSDPIEVPTNSTTALVALDNGRRLLGTGLNGVVLIDVPTRSMVWQLAGRDISPGACSHVAVVAERSTFACADGFGRLEERDLSDGSSIRQLDAQGGDVGSVWSADDGRELVAFNASSPVIARWRLDGSGPIARRMAAGFVPAQYSPNGASLIAAEPAGTYLNDYVPGSSVVVDVESGEVIARLAPLEAAFWQDDRTIIGVVPSDQGLQLARFGLDTRHIEELGYTFTVQLDRNVTNAGQPKAWVTTPIDDDTWEVWTFTRPSGTRIDPTLTVDGLIAISGSPDGERLAASTTTGVIVYDADTGAEKARLDGASDLRGVFFVGDRLLAISSLSGALALYDADTLTKLRTLNGSRGFIEDVQADRAAELVAVRGGDRTVQLIDVASGTPIGGQISIPFDEWRGIALRPDGGEMAVGGGGTDGIAIWDLDPDAWVAAACRLAGRNLTEDEWNTYIGTLAPYRETCATTT